MLLSAQDITKSYGTEHVLQGISLDVEAGRSLAITGPSGAGKTTLLSILGLLLRPSTGKLQFENENVTELREEQRDHLRNQKFGFIFQTANLVGSLTVLDNVLLPSYVGKKSGLRKRAVQLLKELELSHRLEYYPHELSLGQKRRVAMARALLLNPILILADEPTNDLDPKLASWVGDYLFGLPEKGCALVLVTHDPQLAARAGQMVRLADGKLVNSLMASAPE